MPEKRTAEGVERRAAAQRAKRKHMADLKEAARMAAGKTISKEVQRASNYADPRVMLRQRLENNSHQFVYLAKQELGQEAQLDAVGKRVDRVDQRLSDHYALMAQLAEQLTVARDAAAAVQEQNGILSDLLAKATWRIENMETRFGLLRAALTDEAPLLGSLTSLEDIIDGLDMESP